MKKTKKQAKLTHKPSLAKLFFYRTKCLTKSWHFPYPPMAVSQKGCLTTAHQTRFPYPGLACRQNRAYA